MLADHTLAIRTPPRGDAYALKALVYGRLCDIGVPIEPRHFVFGLCPIEGSVLIRCDDDRVRTISRDVVQVPQPEVGQIYEFCLRATPMEYKRPTEPTQWLVEQAEGIGVELLAHRCLSNWTWCSKPTGVREGFFVPDTVYVGRLRVSDAEKLSTALEHGVGRHRAFGYGLLQLFPFLPH